MSVARQGSRLEETMALHLRGGGLPVPVREYRFHPARRWRFDFAWPDRRVALEIEGGTWTGGRHTRGAGFEADVEKYNAAGLAGWTVFRATGPMVSDGRALALMTDFFKREEPNGE